MRNEDPTNPDREPEPLPCPGEGSRDRSCAGGGLGTFLLANHLAAGTPLARAVCGFLALFWSVRFVAGTFVFDLRPYLTNPWRRAGLTAANLVFTSLPVIYGWVALKGVSP